MAVVLAGRGHDGLTQWRVLESGPSPADRREAQSGVRGESTPYIDYESIDVLLSLQHPRSPVHDEMAFYIAGQVMELVFKLAVYGIQAAIAHLEAGSIPAACKLLRRITKTEELLTALWPMLETLTHGDFKGFRDHLGTSSGFQSYMYRGEGAGRGQTHRSGLSGS